MTAAGTKLHQDFIRPSGVGGEFIALREQLGAEERFGGIQDLNRSLRYLANELGGS